MHCLGVSGSLVLVAIQMKQAVDDVETDFMLDGLAIFRGINLGCGGADDDFSMVKSNDVRGALDVHEPPVDIRNDPVGDNNHIHIFQSSQNSSWMKRMLEAFHEGFLGEAAKPCHVQFYASLPVAEGDLD